MQKLNTHIHIRKYVSVHPNHTILRHRVRMCWWAEVHLSRSLFRFSTQLRWQLRSIWPRFVCVRIEVQQRQRAVNKKFYMSEAVRHSHSRERWTVKHHRSSSLCALLLRSRPGGLSWIKRTVFDSVFFSSPLRDNAVPTHEYIIVVVVDSSVSDWQRGHVWVRFFEVAERRFSAVLASAFASKWHNFDICRTQTSSSESRRQTKRSAYFDGPFGFDPGKGPNSETKITRNSTQLYCCCHGPTTTAISGLGGIKTTSITFTSAIAAQEK